MPLEGVLTSEFCYELMALKQAAKSLGAITKTIPVQNVPPAAGVGKRRDFHVQYIKVLDAAKSTSQLLEQPLTHWCKSSAYFLKC